MVGVFPLRYPPLLCFGFFPRVVYKWPSALGRLVAPRLKAWVEAVGWPPTEKSVGWRGMDK